MGFWGDNYSFYDLVIYLNTGYVIPQFNLIFDDLFQTMFSSQAKNSVYNTIFNDLFDIKNDWYV